MNSNTCNTQTMGIYPDKKGSITTCFYTPPRPSPGVPGLRTQKVSSQHHHNATPGSQQANDIRAAEKHYHVTLRPVRRWSSVASRARPHVQFCACYQWCKCAPMARAHGAGNVQRRRWQTHPQLTSCPLFINPFLGFTAHRVGFKAHPLPRRARSYVLPFRLYFTVVAGLTR